MKKRKLLIAPLLLSLSAVSAGAIISATSTTQNHIDTSIKNINTRGFETGGDKPEEGTTFNYISNDDAKKLDWYGKYNVEEFSKLENANDLIKQLVKPSTTTNFTVQIDETITEDMKTNGFLNFKVTWNKNNGNGTYTPEEVKPSGASNSNGWDTKSLTGLFKSTKYQVVWNDSETIKKYILSENKQVSQVQASDVVKYLISPSSNLPENFVSMIKVNQNGNGLNQQYGVLEVSFQNGNNNSEWVDNKLPETRKFRGFISTNGSRHEVEIKSIINSVNGITATAPNSGEADPFGTVFQGLDNRNISSLTPSQFVSVVGDSTTNGNDALVKMLTEGKFLDMNGGGNNGNKKFIDIQYMGKSYTDSDFENTTGIKGTTTTQKNGENDKIEVIGVRTIPNDKDGSLQIVYTIKTFDVYTSTYVTTEFTQSFASGSFKTAGSSSETLSFEWKDSNSIPNNLGSTFDIVNEFRAKSDNDEAFRKSFTNMFFNGSEDVYNKMRSATIDYRSGHGETPDDNGNWVSTNQDTSITVTVTFDDWGGAVYQDTDGTFKKGFKSSSTFYIGVYQYDTQYQKPNWVKNDQLFNSNAAYREMTPSQVTFSISESGTENSPFYGQYNPTVGATSTTIMIPNDSEGIITVKLVLTVQTGASRATAENLIFSQTYTGFKKDTSDNNFQEFGWIPASQVDPQLLAIPIYLVKKSDVINMYLNKIPLFASLNISEDDVNIDSYIDQNSGVGVLKVSVYISTFNQSSSNQSNVGTTVQNTISGFSTVNSSNLANINPPVDNTALISVSCAVLVSVIMSTVLLALISRRAKIRSFKTKKDKPLNINKNQGKSSLDAFADDLEKNIK